MLCKINLVPNGHEARYKGWDSFCCLLGRNSLDIFWIATLESGELYLGNVNVWVKNEPRMTSSDVDIFSTDSGMYADEYLLFGWMYGLDSLWGVNSWWCFLSLNGCSSSKTKFSEEEAKIRKPQEKCIQIAKKLLIQFGEFCCMSVCLHVAWVLWDFCIPLKNILFVRSNIHLEGKI